MAVHLRCFARLPLGTKPLFPRRCIRCFQAEPDRSVTLWVTRTSLWAWIIPLALVFSKVTRVTVPACRGCAWKVRWRRMAGVAVTIALVVAAFGAVYAAGKTWPRLLRRLAAAGAAIVSFVPLVLLEERFPPPLALSIEGDYLRYDFDLLEFAFEFRELNGVSHQE